MRASIQPDSRKTAIAVPSAPVIWATTKKAYVLTAEGELTSPPRHKAQQLIHKTPVIACHMPYTCKKLGLQDLYGFDVLELFAFVHPGTFCVPTPTGVAKALGVSLPASAEDYPVTILECVKALLEDVRSDPLSAKANPLEIAGAMGQQGKGWAWTPFIFEALGQTYNPAEFIISKTALNVWKNLPEWAEEAPEPPPSHFPVTREETLERLTMLLGQQSETRPQQADYAVMMGAAFAPPLISSEEEKDKPTAHIVLAEAGTGTGKTLGYLAPASVWAEKNQGAVWISTYTKNLQRQIDQELDKLYPNKDTKDTFTAIRKGRENYVCLLNVEETAAGAALSMHPNHAIAAGIMARWVAATTDGDLTGATFPGWLEGLLGFEHTKGLADKRGECIFSACDHYHRCFVEKSIRKSKRARLVVANHALVMIQTAMAGEDDGLPNRYIFDEGHHIFEAADSAFAGHLTGRETRDLRRWIIGAEGGKRTRARGLKRRAEDLVAGNKDAENLLHDILDAARSLPGDGWTSRLKESKPKGVCESFLLHIYHQVHARAEDRNGPYSLETYTHPVSDALREEAKKLKSALMGLQIPMQKLSAWLKKHLSDTMDTTDTDTRRRMEAVIAAVDRRARMTLTAWIGMLDDLLDADETNGNSLYVDWMEIERIDGKAVDIGLYRHYVDPMLPFTKALSPHAHGIGMTSATLRDGTGDDAFDWQAARIRTGVTHLDGAPMEGVFPSPFDYAAQTKIFVINDINSADMDQLAAAYESLFRAAGGGALGLFTAISRLKSVHQRISPKLEECGIPLYAQHLDEMDTGTLVDIFREEENACLLGTDAVRDGVDVPGESLRLIVFDKVPWPRPTILHKARRDAFGKKVYDDMTTRFKLKQAYGRLIRRATDKGVFVMLDPRLPTRLCGAFPPGVEIQRVGIATAIKEMKTFL